MCERLPGRLKELYVKVLSMHKYLLSAILLSSVTLCQSQNVGIGTSSPLARLHVTDSDVLFSAIGSVPGVAANPPLSGGGRRTMWYASKAAFRTGYVLNTNWDKDSIGKYSFAAGYDTKAKGEKSSAFGWGTVAEGTSALSAGFETKATGINAVALGYLSTASGDNSIAAGSENSASGIYSFAAGYNSIASGVSSFAFGTSNEASGSYAFAAGYNSFSAGVNSTAFGANTTASGNGSFAIGNNTDATGLNSVSAGVNTIAAGTAAVCLGNNSRANGFASLVIGQYNDTVVATQTSYSSTATPLFIVGNGTSPNSRNNALLINSDGRTGINTSTPQTFLDVNGDFAVKPYNLVLGGAGGPFSNVITSNRSFVHITGPNAPFSVSGFQNGHDGKILVVLNMSGQNMTIENLDTDSDAANRINTLNGSNITTTGNGAVTMIYSGDQNRWMVLSVRD